MQRVCPVLHVRPEKTECWPGYLETPDFRRALDGMESLEVNRRWQSEMLPFFMASSGRPDENTIALAEVFHVD